ncbi:hypothetical protein NEMIN01_2385 [Nematocida minor]|uniref:uncharacterized protein n=1 Tax=Nematocida minor TaxID=1912983 RepID=UPI00221EB557|nr:uncharacterized protein NEMIN01_2385 [Nematocida minor]KAI5193053.1 hypothetical protein NEMIN01_2385 [Nematocida minor]
MHRHNTNSPVNNGTIENTCCTDSSNGRAAESTCMAACRNSAPVCRNIGNAMAGIPRKNRTLSVLYKGRIFYALDRAVVSVPVEERAGSTCGAVYSNIEYMTTVDSTISAMYINYDTVSLGTVAGEVVLMDLKSSSILFKDSVNTAVYSISHTQESILVSIQYQLLKIEIETSTSEKVCSNKCTMENASETACNNYTTVREMNDIVLFSDVIHTNGGSVVVYSNSNSLFVDEQCVTYTGNVVFARAICLPDGSVRVVTGLSTRKVYIYEYQNKKLKLKHLVTTQSLISDGILLPNNTLIVLNNSISIYEHSSMMECVGMVGPYDEDIVKALVATDSAASSSSALSHAAHSPIDNADTLSTPHNVTTSAAGSSSASEVDRIIDSLYIILSSGGVFKYAPRKKTLPSSDSMPCPVNNSNPSLLIAHSALTSVYHMLDRLSALRNTAVNITSGNMAPIKAMEVYKDCVITASASTVRMFKIRNHQLVEVFRPVIDGFPVNAFVTDWNGDSLLTNSNNILKVYKSTKLYTFVVNDVIEKIEPFISKYASYISLLSDSAVDFDKLKNDSVILEKEVEHFTKNSLSIYDHLAFTAVKQELSLTTVPIPSPTPEESEYIYKTIGADTGLSNNHLLETDKIYGFPFEISTMLKINQTLLVSCNSSQKEFSNLFVLNKDLETVQKVFAHTKTITHILSSESVVLTIGKDRAIAIYRMLQNENAPVELLDTKTDHKKEILTGYFRDNRIITASKDNTVKTYEIKNEKLSIVKTETVYNPVTSINSLEIKTKTVLILGDTNGCLTIDNIKHKLHNAPITHIEIYRSKAETSIITATNEGVLKITDIRDLIN